jgi:DNA-directed RNA polymerase subunit delta
MKTYRLGFTAEQALEMPMVDIAFEILKTIEPAETPFQFTELIQEVVKVKGLQLDSEQLVKLTAQLFTDVNIDGRFASTRNRTWGLKSWQTLNKDEILNIDDGIDEEEDIAVVYDEDGINVDKIALDGLGDSIVAEDAVGNSDYTVVGDPYSEEEDDLDNKVIDEDLPEIEGIPDLEGDLSLEDMKLEEEQDNDDLYDSEDSDDDL